MSYTHFADAGAQRRRSKPLAKKPCFLMQAAFLPTRNWDFYEQMEKCKVCTGVSNRLNTHLGASVIPERVQ